MKSTIFFLLIFISIFSCSKHHQYKACFTTTKDTFAVGEKVVFTNCSNFDGGFTNCIWNFGEGPPSRSSSMGNDDASYTFTYPGNKTVLLLIGEKENESDTLKVLFIK